jgi:hypothetical protein
MKSSVYKIMFGLSAFIFLAGCKQKFEDYSRNNNLPLSVPPGVALRAVMGNLIVYPGGYEDKADQYIVSNYTYYGDNKYWTGSAGLNYGTLNNVIAMEGLANKANSGNDNNPYHALGLFFRAFFFVNMSEKVGDLPMTEALQGINNISPKYDTQKDIFKQSLQWLDSANIILAGLLTNGFLEFSGDFYYNPSDNSSSARAALVNWQKAVNSYRLRVLIELSKKADDADLGVKQQFAAILADPTKYPIFTSNDDNLQYVYNDKYNYYPDNTTNYGNNAGRLNVAATYLNTLSTLNDIRAMVIAEPARGLGFADTDYRSFKGGGSGVDLGTLATESGAKRLSLYNFNHYYSGYTAEPTIIIGYPEVCFAIAEGINRGWATGSADTWYQNGIKASFGFYGIKDGANTVTFRNDDGTTNVTYNVTFNFADYLNQSAVKYAGDNNTGLTQILTQKYLAYFRNSGLQSYYQWRRTGVPVFDVGTGTGNGGVIPRRFQYPSNESSVNSANLDAALQSQYGGSDDIGKDVWIVQ